MTRLLARILHLFFSEGSAIQIGFATAFGMTLGLAPLLSPHNLIIFLLVCFFRINFFTFFLSAAFFKLLATVSTGYFDWLGYYLLVDVKVARPLWLFFATNPIWPYFRLNYTVVVGSIFTSFVLWVPVFLASFFAARWYQKNWKEALAQSSVAKAFQKTALFKVYASLSVVAAAPKEDSAT